MGGHTQNGLNLTDKQMLELDGDAAADAWPVFPFLPLKNTKRCNDKDPLGEMGVILHGQCPRGAYCVFKVNMVVLSYSKDRKKFLDEAIQENFASTQDLLDAGWVVD